MKYLYLNKHWPVNEEYNLDKLLFLMIDRPNYINNVGDFVWMNDKLYHRDYDLPTLFGHIQLIVFWHRKSQFHRKSNKPAVIYSNGNKSYFTNNDFIKEERSKK